MCCLRGIVSLMVILIVGVGLANTGTTAAMQSVRPVVRIDGSKEPDRIPEWILWEEIFDIAAILAEKESDRGRDLWIETLHLNWDEMLQVVARGQELKQLKETMDKEAERLIQKAGNKPESIQAELSRMQLRKEAEILVLKEKLRSSLSGHGFQRIMSFARLHIAPGIVMGDFVTDPE
jgi:hypothetical protein